MSCFQEFLAKGKKDWYENEKYYVLMASYKRRFMDFASEIWPERKVNFNIIGKGIKFIGPVHWERGMLFGGAPDIHLKELSGVFPCRLKGRGIRHTHPLYVLNVHKGLFHRVSPCTTKYHWGCRFIRAGCVLGYTEKKIEVTTFILDSHAFNVPWDHIVIKRLKFWGLVPDECIERLCFK